MERPAGVWALGEPQGREGRRKHFFNSERRPGQTQTAVCNTSTERDKCSLCVSVCNAPMERVTGCVLFTPDLCACVCGCVSPCVAVWLCVHACGWRGGSALLRHTFLTGTSSRLSRERPGAVFWAQRPHSPRHPGLEREGEVLTQDKHRCRGNGQRAHSVAGASLSVSSAQFPQVTCLLGFQSQSPYPWFGTQLVPGQSAGCVLCRNTRSTRRLPDSALVPPGPPVRLVQDSSPWSVR